MRAKYSIVNSSQANRIKGTVLSTFMLAAVLTTGCTHYQPIGTVNSNLLDPQGKITLYVANHSYAVSPVDIRVEIDGQTVVNGYFRRGRREPTASLRSFKLALEPGMHKLHVVSRRGKAELLEEFEVKGEHWASVGYCYCPDTQEPKQFVFHFRNEQIGFK